MMNNNAYTPESSEKGNEEENIIYKSYIVFKLGKEEYGIKIEKVKEVTLTPTISEVPHMPSYVKGLVNIRGDIITVLDLEEMFNIDSHGNQQRYTLVTEQTDFQSGVLVSEVPWTMNIPVNAIDTSPEIFKKIKKESNLIEGIANYGEKIIVLLDIEKILEEEEEDPEDLKL
ncbi:chemotaxis protein CheW [Cytophagaceae bacterium ABcell3]|nr:chemotaxis protein CheW [Cytophagaceae bacterium ABcell3]